MNSVLFECYVKLMDLTENEESSFRKYNQDFGSARDIFSEYWNFLSSNISNDNLLHKLYDHKMLKVCVRTINNPKLFDVLNKITNDIYKFDRDYKGKCNNFPFWLHRLLAIGEVSFDYFNIDEYYKNLDYALIVDAYLEHIGDYLDRYFKKYKRLLYLKHLAETKGDFVEW